MPTTIADEAATNPFMRVAEPAIVAATGQSDPAAAMKAVRAMKDEWGRRKK